MIGTFGRVGMAVCLTALVGAASGCGSDPYQTATVTGTVLCDGKPAHGGVIRFRPVDAPDETGRPAGYPGQEAYATVQDDGSFTLVMDMGGHAGGTRGALIGRHQVFFELPRTSAPQMDAEDRANYADDPEMLAEIQRRLDEVRVYEPLSCGAGVTPAEVEVKPGTNHFEFTLQPN